MWWKRFKKDPEFHRIVVTKDKYSSSGSGIIGLIEPYFKKYGFNYKEVDDKDRDFHDRLFHYEIEINYKDKDYVDVLLNRVFRYGDKKPLSLNEYERWLKTERLRRKILNI